MDMVSIVVTADGDAQHLTRTLESLLQLRSVPFEILVADRLDQGSVCAALAQNPLFARQVRYLALPPDTKPGTLLNAAAQLARGAYLTFLEAGTTLSPMWLSVAVNTLERSSASQWCYTGAGIRGTGDALPPQDWPDFKTEGNIFPDLMTSWGLSLQSVVLTRQQLYALDGFDEDLTALVEEEFLLRLVEQTAAVYTHTQMVELNHQPELLSPDALVSRCYFMSAFLPSLDRFGLKKEVLEALLADIDGAGAQEVTAPYLEVLGGDPEYQACIQAYHEEWDPRQEILPAGTPNISGVKNCVGCGSCAGGCPTGAISMVPGDDGLFYPRVDEKRCTQCGLCLTLCPTQRQLPGAPLPRVYHAVQASDPVRMGASSGGVFPLLAQEILREGGYVAGAVFDKDFSVHHIVSNRPEDIRAMQTSKYVQSATAQVYPQVRDLLEDGQTVLFTGTACQMAGLLAFLGKPYDNLYTMDVVCHGVPSPGVFAQYLKEFQRPDDPIVEVNFRKKDVIGWTASLYLRYASGKTYAPKGGDLYMLSFLSNWILRESCYDCPFKGKKYSDLTAADFWGIAYLDKHFEDGKGTSFLTVNTEKGQRLYDKIRGSFTKTAQFGREAEEVLSIANPNIRKSVARPPFRDIFFQQWQKDPRSLNNVLARGFSSCHFDIGLVLFWGPNHGNALTNFALYKALSKNHSVVAIDNAVSRPTGRFLDFAKRNYVCSSDCFPAGNPHIVAHSCDTLVVGSDQLWNIRFSPEGSKYYQLDFAGDDVKKIAYGASFGAREFAPPAEGYTELYRRFDKIGVREKFGVEVCRERYGAEADFVLDPVFLLDPEEYEALARQSRRSETEPFLFCYMLFPNKELMEFRRKLQARLGGIKIISATQANWETRDDLRHTFEFEHVQKDVTVEDWLYYVKNARYILTDSFHASCFSLFFKKDFAAVPHAVSDRFTTLTLLGDTGSHMSTELSDAFLEQCLKPLDYDKIDRDLQRERKRSRKWLEDALK